MLSPKRALPLKPTPPPFRNHGNYVVSVAELSRWLAEKAEEAGAYILTETSADTAAGRGRRRARRPLGRQGPRQGRRAAGQLRARLRRRRPGHGARRGHAGAISPAPRSASSTSPPTASRRCGRSGVKEVWEVPQAARPRHPHARLAAALPAPSTRSSAAPGSTRWASDRGLDRLRRRPRLHRRHRSPATTCCRSSSSTRLVRRILEGGKRVAWGAKAIPEGGYWAMPKLHGARAWSSPATRGGMVNVPELKGIHYAIQAGMLAAETIYRAAQGAARPTSAATSRPSRTRSSARTSTSRAT